MKIRTLLMGAAFCAMLSACAVAPDDTTEKAEAIQKKADELGKFVTPLYMGVYAHEGHIELDVQTCPQLHQNNVPIEDMCQGTGDIQQALITVRDNRLRLVNVIVEDRPGGGCIHIDIASALPGYTISALAIVKGAPGAAPYAVARSSIVVPAAVPESVH